jgi:hypothetical protein
MFIQQPAHECNTRLRPDVGQSNKPGMRMLINEDQQAEILVHRDENASLGGRPGQDGRIAGIGPVRGDFLDIMALAAQPFRKPVAGAGVDQESHSPATRIASSVSRAMTAWA